MNDHPSDAEIANALAPFHTCFASVCQRIEEQQLVACAALGLPRKTERPTDWHRAWRNLFILWCDETGGTFEFVSESDRFHLDYVMCHLLMDKPFAIRFGRLNNGAVKRNSSRRQSGARAHGMLSSEFLIDGLDDPGPGELRQVTLAYSLADDVIEGGVPMWWMDRLVIGKETLDGFDEISEVATFERPHTETQSELRAVYVPKPAERERWRRQIDDAMGGAA